MTQAPPNLSDFPDDRLYDLIHDMWAKREGDGVVVGATAWGLHLAGEIIGFTAKPRGAEVDAGRALGTVESAKTVLSVRAPVAFILSEANAALEENAAPLNVDPYEAGWMARGQPRAWNEDANRLVDAATYRAHVARQQALAVNTP